VGTDRFTFTANDGVLTSSAAAVDVAVAQPGRSGGGGGGGCSLAAAGGAAAAGGILPYGALILALAIARGRRGARARREE
jgi:hypothetical protein